MLTSPISTMLPEGSVVTRRYRKQETGAILREHHLRRMFTPTAGLSMFLPMKDARPPAFTTRQYRWPSITANMLSYLMFNRFQMSTPAYRSKNRLSDMD